MTIMTKQKFLLHTCCAPCSIAIVDELKGKFELTVFFYNPNIYPAEEYLKRKAEVIKICNEWNVPMVDMDYEFDYWNAAVKGLEKEPETGARCPVCFKLRLAKTAEYAVKNKFDYFGTSLTGGRNKKAEVINPIGISLAEQNKIKSQFFSLLYFHVRSIFLAPSFLLTTFQFFLATQSHR